MSGIEFTVPAMPKAGTPVVDGDERYSVHVPIEGDDGPGLRFHEPTPQQALILSQANSRMVSDYDKIVLIFSFLKEIMEPEGYQYLYGRFVSRDGNFGIDDLEKMLTAVAKHFNEHGAANRAEKRALAKKA